MAFLCHFFDSKQHMQGWSSVRYHETRTITTSLSACVGSYIHVGNCSQFAFLQALVLWGEGTYFDVLVPAVISL